ncbi:hypothetical protein [Mumia sp. DW29H23]|uniref:hypothetical protein n=1 Tax=Mumia sp. DW29H23 TaxID=3421241 RepID=UPI003D697437
MRIEAGWVVVDLPGVDPLVPVAIAVGEGPAQPAFRDTLAGRPVAKVPVLDIPRVGVRIYLELDGSRTEVGRFTG